MYSKNKIVGALLCLPFLASCEQSIATRFSGPSIIVDQYIAATMTASSIRGSLAFNTSDFESISIKVITPPLYGQVSFPNKNAEFIYELTDLKGLYGDYFTIEVTNGEAVNTAKIELNISDITAPNISVQALGNVETTNFSIKMISDDPLNLGTVTTQSINGFCSGTIQLSDDNFVQCSSLKVTPTSKLGHHFTIEPISPLKKETLYKLKISGDVQNHFNIGTAQTINPISTFSTGLVINEVGSSYYANSMRWFELFNGNNHAVNLSDYRLASRQINELTNTVSDNGEFVLPNIVIPGNQYVIVRSQNWTKPYDNTDDIIYLKNGYQFPFWNEQGYLNIIENSTGQSVDFVTFGAAYSISADFWKGSPATLVSNPDSFGQSIGRNAIHKDSNSALDWQAYNPGTFGSTNDVECATDYDQDMIPDCNEQARKTFSGMPLFDWGARAGTTDIFIEVDYMASSDEGVKPRKEALDKVVSAFAKEGINLHFDVGDLYDRSPGLNPDLYDLGGGNILPFAKAMTFDPSNGEASFYDYKSAFFDNSRLQLFHYMIMAHSQNKDGSAGPSGLAEIGSNDIIVTLGDWGLNSSSASAMNKLINFQAGTIMHELGHNLGLLHGGGDRKNYKPNYLSVMNYEYQLVGLPEIGHNEADRMHDRFDDRCKTEFNNGPATDYNKFVISFSNGTSQSLNEKAIDETEGLGRTGSGVVDFNCNDSTERALAKDLDGDEGLSTLRDHNDWANLITDFGGLSNTSRQGARQSSNLPSRVIAWPTKIIDDRSAPVIKETLLQPQK